MRARIASVATFIAFGSLSAQEVDLRGMGRDRGDPNAPVVVVEFADFGCPSCAEFATGSWTTIEREYVDTGKVLWKLMPFAAGASRTGGRPRAPRSARPSRVRSGRCTTFSSRDNERGDACGTQGPSSRRTPKPWGCRKRRSRPAIGRTAAGIGRNETTTRPARCVSGARRRSSSTEGGWRVPRPWTRFARCSTGRWARAETLGDRSAGFNPPFCRVSPVLGTHLGRTRRRGRSPNRYRSGGL